MLNTYTSHLGDFDNLIFKIEILRERFFMPKFIKWLVSYETWCGIYVYKRLMI